MKKNTFYFKKNIQIKNKINYGNSNKHYTEDLWIELLKTNFVLGRPQIAIITNISIKTKKQDNRI